MTGLPLNFSSINIESLINLQQEGVRENRKLEFKRDFNFQTDSNKREMLADISSFSNSQGGDILFGVEEDKDESGLIGDLVGIEGDPDKIILQLDESLRKGINPRIPGIQFKPIFLENKKFVLVIRIPKSIIGPHMVTYSECFRIYGRAENSRPALSTQEIRDIVLATDSLSERINRYRMSRVSQIISGETPTPIENGPVVIVHLMPYESFAGSISLSALEIERQMQSRFLLPLGSGGQRYHPTYEGVVIPSDRVLSSAYSLVTKTGIAEGVSVDFTYEGSKIDKNVLPNGPWINDFALIQHISSFLEKSQKVLASLNLTLPFTASITLAGINGYSIQPDSIRQEAKIISKDVLNLGQIEIEREIPTALEWAMTIRPLFDVLAQSTGYWQSNQWDENGDLKVGLKNNIIRAAH